MSGKARDAVGKWWPGWDAGEPGQMGERFGVQFKDFLGWKDYDSKLQKHIRPI